MENKLNLAMTEYGEIKPRPGAPCSLSVVQRLCVSDIHAPPSQGVQLFSIRRHQTSPGSTSPCPQCSAGASPKSTPRPPNACNSEKCGDIRPRPEAPCHARSAACVRLRNPHSTPPKACSSKNTETSDLARRHLSLAAVQRVRVSGIHAPPHQCVQSAKIRRHQTPPGIRNAARVRLRNLRSAVPRRAILKNTETSDLARRHLPMPAMQRSFEKYGGIRPRPEPAVQRECVSEIYAPPSQRVQF